MAISDGRASTAAVGSLSFKHNGYNGGYRRLNILRINSQFSLFYRHLSLTASHRASIERSISVEVGSHLAELRRLKLMLHGCIIVDCQHFAPLQATVRARNIAATVVRPSEPNRHMSAGYSIGL
jgi:hypothetical protein